ncbi:unnamed protein product, partial [Discosporangium mesarthrocarpum]
MRDNVLTLASPLQAGNVKFVDLFQEPGGRSKGCALVEYEREDEAHTAIRELNDTDLMGRMIFVREDREEVREGREGQGGRQVFVGNLSWDADWKDLK